MAESFRLFISGLDPFSLAILVLGIFGVLILLPKAITEAGIRKLGPIQMEQENQTLNHLTQKQIEEIDLSNRENLWELTEDTLAEATNLSQIPCHAAINSKLNAIISPLRTLVLINHIAPKLAMKEEEFLLQKITRSAQRTFREIKFSSLPAGCPVAEKIAQTEQLDYYAHIKNWLGIARNITAKACLEKLKVYDNALKQTKDKHWKEIFSGCYNKNLGYIEAMGFKVSKTHELEA